MLKFSFFLTLQILTSPDHHREGIRDWLHKEALLKLELGYKVELLTKSCFDSAAAANFSYY